MPDLGPYSPVTLNGEWSNLSRLLLLISLTSFGTIVNGFFVASFFVHKVLRAAGYVFLCCLGLADMIITTVVMPICVVVLVSKQWNSLIMCKFLQFITEGSTSSYSLLFMMVAVESYIRICCCKEAYGIFRSIQLNGLIVIIGTLTFGFSYLGVYYDQDYDYCERKHHGNIYFRRYVDLFFYFIPGIIIVVMLVMTSIEVRRKLRSQVRRRRSRQYQTDSSMTNLYILNYGVFVFSWLPYLALVYNDPDASSPLYYNFVWFAMIRSVITSVISAIFNINFRESFLQIFNYCRRKNDLTSLSHRRHRRRVRRGEGRVHMIQENPPNYPDSRLPQRNIRPSLYATSEL